MRKAKLKKKIVKQEEKNASNFSIKGAIILILVMLIVLVGFYFLTVKIVDKQNKEKENIQEDIVDVRSLNDINYSDVKNMVANSYYLLINKKDDKNNENYDLFINSLKYNNFGTEFYYIDLSKDENKDLLADSEKLEKLDELKVKDTTLIYVEDGKIKETYVGGDKIIKHLTSFFNNEESSNSNKETAKSTDSNESKKEEKKEEKSDTEKEESDDKKTEDNKSND